MSWALHKKTNKLTTNLNKMNKLFLTTRFLFAIIITGFGQGKNFIDQPCIEVQGVSDTLVTPNLIYIKIVISEKDSRDKLSVEEQENKMVSILKSININTEENLTTSDILSNYKSYFLKHKDILKTKEYTLKVTNSETASKVFIELEDLGISNTSIDKVEHSDLANLKNGCRNKAILNAYKKAVAMTIPISQTIGNAIHIFDNEAKFDDSFSGRVYGVAVNGYSTKDKVKYPQPKIEFEKIKVTATVSVKFILK